MGDVLCSVRILLNISVHSLFLNSVPLSVSIFFDGQNTQQMLSVYAFITSSAFLDFIGIQKVNPVSMHTAVSAYLFPLHEGGVKFSNQVHGNEFHWFWWYLEVFLLDLLDFYVVLCTCVARITVSLNSLFHTFPMVHLFE